MFLLKMAIGILYLPWPRARLVTLPIHWNYCSLALSHRYVLVWWCHDMETHSTLVHWTKSQVASELMQYNCDITTMLSKIYVYIFIWCHLTWKYHCHLIVSAKTIILLLTIEVPVWIWVKCRKVIHKALSKFCQCFTGLWLYMFN